MTKYITIRMTLEEALRQGLIVCTCGHPTNNHFNFTNSCARCDCLKYRPVARVGKLVKEAPKCQITRAAPANTSRISRTRSTGCSSERTTGRSRTSAKLSSRTILKGTSALTSKHRKKA